MADMAAKARAAAVHFEARKIAYRQTKEGVVVSFVVHPNDVPDSLAVAQLGTRYLLALVELSDDETPVPPAESEASATEQAGGAPKVDTNNTRAGHRSEQTRERYLMKDRMEQAVVRCGILSAKPAFQDWFLGKRKILLGPGDDVEKAVAASLRGYLGVNSRSEISSNDFVYQRFLALETSYHQSQGLLAEKRG